MKSLSIPVGVSDFAEIRQNAAPSAGPGTSSSYYIAIIIGALPFCQPGCEIFNSILQPFILFL